MSLSAPFPEIIRIFAAIKPMTIIKKRMMKKYGFGLLCLLAFLPSGLWGQDKWCVVDMANPDTPLTAVDNVCFLLTADDTPTLTVVCRDGQLIGGVGSVGFRQLDMTAINTPKAGGEIQLVGSAVSESISILGCAEGTEVRIYDLAGHQLKAVTATGGQLTIGVGDLKSGVYLLKAGTVTIKFARQ